MRRIPISSLVWLAAALLVFFVGQSTVSLQDEERFVNDIVVERETVDEPNTVRLNIISGTFAYNIVPETPVALTVGTFTPDSNDSELTTTLIESIADITEVTVSSQEIRVSYESDMEADAMLNRVRRLVTNFVLNDAETITSSVNDAGELVFTTSDEQFEYGQFVPALIPEGEEEVYTSREAGLAGSPLARTIFEQVNSVEGLTITPDHLLVTYREGTAQPQLINRVQDALNAFYPRASLQPDLWVFTVEASAEKIIQILPVDSGIPLFLFTIGFALVELLLFIALYNSNDKLIRPIVRVIGVFLFFWSIFGHEPLWDFLLSNIFPNSRQLVHPSATVIEFAAQHLELVLVSSLITIPGGLFFGILVTRESFREVLPLVNNLVNSGQTVPTIAIVAIMAPIIGFGFWPAIIALVAYGLLPVVRNTIAGLEAVDAFIIDSARGMGMTPAQILFQIELPIASSIIMAGIRTSMVINVGTATLGAFVGSGGLGTPIASGLAMTIDAFVLLGAIPAALLAILVDYILGRIEFVLTPRGLQLAS